MKTAEGRPYKWSPSPEPLRPALDVLHGCTTGALSHLRTPAPGGRGGGSSLGSPPAPLLMPGEVHASQQAAVFSP